MTDPARAAETAARASYGRLLAILAARTRDIAAAEDALSEAFARALTTWPETGVPQNPDAWLLTTARNRLTDHQRRDTRLVPQEEAPEMTAPDAPAADPRLGLMFACAHPAIDPAIHTPLMLQCVLGLEAKQIAQALLVAPATMAQRLVRAKSKIKAAGIPFHIPEATDLAPRARAVQEAIYGALSQDWLAPGDDLGAEALYLADLLAQLLPTDAEAKGLAALIAFSLSRAPARMIDETFVPLPDQNTGLWDSDLIARAQVWLRQAQALGEIGPFQLEAAIQAVHADRRITGTTNWLALVALLTGLTRLYPTAGNLVALAAATGEAQGPDAGLHILAQLPEVQAQAFQPYFATRAHLLSQRDPAEAYAAYSQAIELTHEAPLRRFLVAKREDLRPH